MISGFPLVVTIAYSALRQIFDNEECWVSPSKVFWIEWTIMGPCLIALCVSFTCSIVCWNYKNSKDLSFSYLICYRKEVILNHNSLMDFAPLTLRL